MILKSYRYFCDFNVEGAYINMKLIIGNGESGTGSLFLLCVNVSDISKLYNRKQRIGSRELVPCSFFSCIIPMFQKCKIENKEPVPVLF